MDIEICNVKATYTGEIDRYFIPEIKPNMKISVKNVEVTMGENVKHANSEYKLANKIYADAIFEVKNFVLNLSKYIIKAYLYTTDLGQSSFDGILVKSKYDSSLNRYYGEDFSGYYVSWRTGKIGFIAFDGRGFFQGKIDEEWLTNCGYEKMTF